MQKKLISITIVMELIISIFAGCASDRFNQDATVAEAVSDESIITTETPTANIINVDSFTSDDVDAMGNYMNFGCTAISGSWVYGTSFKSNGNGVLTKIKIDGSEQTVLSNAFSQYITIQDGWIYYIAYDHNTQEQSIRRIRISGEDEQTIVDSPNDDNYLDFLFLSGNYIYYSVLDESTLDKPTGKFIRCDLNGNNQKVIINKAVYFPYIIGDSILYQDDNDYCRIHRCDLDGNNDSVFIDEWVYQYIFDGKYFYYNTYANKLLSEESIREYLDDNSIGYSEEYQTIIKRCDINGENNKDIINFDSVGRFILHENSMIFSNETANYKPYSYNIIDGTVDVLSQDAETYRFAIIGNKLSYFTRDDDGYINSIVMINFDGTNKTDIFD